MAGALNLGPHVAHIVGVEGSVEGLAVDDFDTRLAQRPNLLGVVGQELHAVDPRYRSIATAAS